MKIIGWNATSIDFVLLGNDLQTLLYLSILLSIISIVTFYFLLKRVKQLEDNCIVQNKFDTDTRTILNANQQDIRRLFRKVEPSVENIETLQQQIALINELLGTVMGASDFMAGGYDSPADRVEGIRERLKWEREKRKLNQVNDSDFYEG